MFRPTKSLRCMEIISVAVALDEASVCGRGRESGAESGEELLAERG
jgi:hypothetical protein